MNLAAKDSAPAPTSHTSSDVTTCPACNSTLTDAHLLPCLHFLCAKCIVGGGSGSNPTCPLCGDASAYAGSGTTEPFPAQECRFIDTYARACRVRDPDMKCSACAKPMPFDPDGPPRLLCDACDLFVCDACVSTHNCCPNFRLVNVAADADDPESDVTKWRPSPCPVHGGGGVEDATRDRYCLRCDVTACRKCLEERHRNCPDALPLGEAVERRRAELDAVHDGFSDLLATSDGKLKEDRRFVKDATQLKERLRCEVKDASRMLKELVSSMEQNTLKELDAIFDSPVQSRQAQIQEAEALVAHCTRAVDALGTAMSVSAEAEILPALKHLAADLESRGRPVSGSGKAEVMKSVPSTPRASSAAKAGRPVPASNATGNTPEKRRHSDTGNSGREVKAGTDKRNSRTPQPTKDAKAGAKVPEKPAPTNGTAPVTPQDLLQVTFQRAAIEEKINGATTLGRFHHPSSPPARPPSLGGQSSSLSEWNVNLQLEICFHGGTREDIGDPLLTDIVLLPNSDVIVTDRDNKCVKKFNSAGMTLTRVPVPEVPSRIALVSQGRAVVSVMNKKVLLYLSLQGTLRILSYVKTKKQYAYVASARTGSLVVGTNMCDTIDIVTEKGELLKTIYHQKPDKALISRPLYLVHNATGEVIASDSGKKSLFCLTKEGTVRFTYKPKDGSAEGLECPLGVACDVSSFVLLADRDANKMVVLTPDGKFVKNALTAAENVVKPCGLFVFGDSFLAMTQVDGYIKIFRMERL